MFIYKYLLFLKESVLENIKVDILLILNLVVIMLELGLFDLLR